MTALFVRVAALYAKGLAAPLPGLWPDPRLTGAEQMVPAAVLVAITDRPRPGLLLLHRPGHMRAHPGQIAFPGGRCDPGEDTTAAALREAQEELGIEPAVVRIVGASDVYRTGSLYAITPVVAVVPADLPIIANPAEVAQWFEAPVDYLFDPANQVGTEIEVEGRVRPVLEIVWREHRIWGVTAAIIANLSRRLDWPGYKRTAGIG